MKEWAKIVLESKNPKVLLMLSGGKDSIATAILLKENSINVEAIHFIHAWGSSIPTNEAKRICSEYSIPLKIVDFTAEFCSSILGYTGGRPCLLCKKEMYKKLLSIICENDYGWLAIGDNADDRTTIARIKNYILESSANKSLECTSYFGSEMGIKLPDGMRVLRPIIHMKAIEVESFLARKHVKVRRINSTGDKYFEYHREGCPIQFADLGVPLTTSIFDKLKVYNEAVTEYARENHFLASVHIPSTFVVTVPKGYEEKSLQYLISRGLGVNLEINRPKNEGKMYFAYIKNISAELLKSRMYKKIVSRMSERLEIKCIKNEYIIADKLISADVTGLGVHLSFFFDFVNMRAMIHLEFYDDSSLRMEFGIFDNLIVELFHTRDYIVAHN